MDRSSLPIRVNHPRRLPGWQLPAERIAIGRFGDYKPSLALLPDGELLLVAFHKTGTYGETDFHEQTTFWRSGDGGKTWSDRDDRDDIIGREQFLTCMPGGTLFMTSHLLPEDNAHPGGAGGYHSYLHRSTDGGKTWDRTQVLLEGALRRDAPEQSGTVTDREVVALPDGTLLLGVALDGSTVAYMWRSTDGGESWERDRPCRIRGYYDNGDAFFSNSFTYCNEAGNLLHWCRVGPPSPMYPMGDGRPAPVGDDQNDRTMWTQSTDQGRTWECVEDFGDYGQMYWRMLKLRDGRLLATFTQRGIVYPFGLRATMSYDDGQTWDFACDQIVIEGLTPWGAPSGGGYGNTVQLDDGTLVTCYGYNPGKEPSIKADASQIEVVRWELP